MCRTVVCGAVVVILLNEGTIQCGWVCDVRIGMTDVSVLVDDCEVFVTNM